MSTGVVNKFPNVRSYLLTQGSNMVGNVICTFIIAEETWTQTSLVLCQLSLTNSNAILLFRYRLLPIEGI
jgi:hypothetical protein